MESLSRDALSPAVIMLSQYPDPRIRKPGKPMSGGVLLQSQRLSTGLLRFTPHEKPLSPKFQHTIREHAQPWSLGEESEAENSRPR